MIAIVVGFACALAVVLLVPTYIDRKHEKTGSEWYKEHIRTNINIAPPTIVFPIVWSLLYLCIAAAIALWAFIQPSSEWTSGRFMATWTLFSANLLFNRLWTLIFFSFRDKTWSVSLALFDAFLILGTAIAIVVFFHLSPEHNGWIFGLWYPYIAWCAFAFTLTLAIWLGVREGKFGTTYASMNEMRVFQTM